VGFGVLSAFPVFDRWSDQLSDYIFSNFVPSSARAVETYLRQFSLNAGQLTAAGIVALVFSLLVTLSSVETTFNRIWRVPTARPKVARFLVYWTVFTLGALVAATSLRLSTRFFAMAIFETQPGQWLENIMVRLTPFTIELIAFAAVFKVVPHRTVLWRHAFGGALLAALLFEMVKWGLGVFIGNFSSYGKVYGTLAFLPIFLVWIYLGWTSIPAGRFVRRVDGRRSATSRPPCACRSVTRCMDCCACSAVSTRRARRARACTARRSRRSNRCSPIRWCRRCSASCA
jgi:membrane protein